MSTGKTSQLIKEILPLKTTALKCQVEPPETHIFLLHLSHHLQRQVKSFSSQVYSWRSFHNCKCLHNCLYNSREAIAFLQDNSSTFPSSPFATLAQVSLGYRWSWAEVGTLPLKTFI